MALAEGIDLRDTATRHSGDVVLGDDFVAPDSTVDKELRVRRERRGLLSLNRSPLTRKIITFNLIALNILVAGVLLLNSSRDSFAVERANALVLILCRPASTVAASSVRASTWTAAVRVPNLETNTSVTR